MSDFVSSRTLNAAKEHRCLECGRSIGLGETYVRAAASWDGQFQAFSTCGHCQVYRAEAGRMDPVYHDENYYGGLSEWDRNRGWEAAATPAEFVRIARLAVGFRRQWRTRTGELVPVPAAYDKPPEVVS